jgi:hypothetical protein
MAYFSTSKMEAIYLSVKLIEFQLTTRSYTLQEITYRSVCLIVIQKQLAGLSYECHAKYAWTAGLYENCLMNVTQNMHGQHVHMKTVL